MKLYEFIDRWTRNNHTVYICLDKYYDDMFDLIDDINAGDKKIEEIKEYTICAFIPCSCDFIVKYYLKYRFAAAEVEYFYTGDGYMIIWIEEVNECQNGEY